MQKKLGIVHCTYLRVTGDSLNCIFYLKIFFTFTNSEDPDEMQHVLHFIWAFTVCKCPHLGVS